MPILGKSSRGGGDGPMSMSILKKFSNGRRGT